VRIALSRRIAAQTGPDHPACVADFPLASQYHRIPQLVS
jgi:hypothetical protein